MKALRRKGTMKMAAEGALTLLKVFSYIQIPNLKYSFWLTSRRFAKTSAVLKVDFDIL